MATRQWTWAHGATTSTHVHANGADVAFGVAARAMGMPSPGRTAICPSTDLANNTALTGTVAWEGLLLGFTPGAAPVAGDAALSVALGTMTGHADFTRLESLGGRTSPGRCRHRHDMG